MTRVSLAFDIHTYARSLVDENLRKKLLLAASIVGGNWRPPRAERRPNGFTCVLQVAGQWYQGVWNKADQHWADPDGCLLLSLNHEPGVRFIPIPRYEPKSELQHKDSQNATKRD